MTLSAGSPIGPYTVLVPIGTGGMGEVYKARDTRLGREVALKILPAGRALDRSFINRFRQEARTASSLNHPNIITIYEVGEAHQLHFIAMELVDGQTLAEVLCEGAMSVSQTIRIGSQIADGLAKAHAAGIVHRDLKPANIMITRDGYAKILDFGLAKAFAGGDATTLSGPAAEHTRPGVVMGTLGYMSPEQSAGDPVDYRADQFCLGTILYEMITGQRAFERPTSQATLLAIIQDQPVPVARLNPLAPPLLRTLIERCLAKKPDERYAVTADLADTLRLLREEITDATASRLQRSLAGRGRRWPLVVAAVAVLLLLGVLGVLILSPDAPWSPFSAAAAPGLDYAESRPLEESESELSAPSLSPDGKMVVFGRNEGGRRDLFVRRVAGDSTIRLTDDDAVELGPRFSPDGETIAFYRHVGAEAASELRLIPALGGAQKTICAGAADPAWSPDGQRLALVQRDAQGYLLVHTAVDGTDRRKLLAADAVYPFLSAPAWSPTGDSIAVVRGRGGASRDVWLVPIDGSAPRPLLASGEGIFTDSPAFTADGRGVVCSSNRLGATNLWLVPVDGGTPSQITKGAGPDLAPSLAGDGTLVYLTSQWRQALRVRELQGGTERELLRHSSFLWSPVFSPDGTHLAYSRGEADGGCHIWVIPLAGGTPRQLTSGPIPTIYPRFTPDGESILYYTWSSAGRNRCWSIPFAGGAPRTLTPDHDAEEGYPDMAPDGASLAFVRAEDGAEFVYVISPPGSAPRRLTEGRSTVPRWSPDGAWIAYAPDRSYAGGIFVIRPDGSGARRISPRGGWPTWWPDGARIGYLMVGPDGNQGVETVTLEGGRPQLLNDIGFRTTNHPFDISRDGRWFASGNSVHFLSNIWLLRPR